MRGRPPRKELTEEQRRAAEKFVSGAERSGAKESSSEQLPPDRMEDTKPKLSDPNASPNPDRDAENRTAESSPYGFPTNEVAETDSLEPGQPAGQESGREGERPQNVASVQRQPTSQAASRRSGKSPREEDRLASRFASRSRGFQLREDPPASGSNAHYPWEEDWVRGDVIKGFSLRLPEPLYLKLKYVSEQTGDSMNQLVKDAVRDVIEMYLPEEW